MAVYFTALPIAIAAVGIHVAFTGGAASQASSGTYAFGDALLFVAIFGVCALVPTGAALVFLRPYRRFWMILSTLGLNMAVAGIAAAACFAIDRQSQSSSFAARADISVLRILVAPLFALGFLVCAALLPHRFAQVALAAAAAMEATVTAYGSYVRLVPILMDRLFASDATVNGW